MISSPVALDRSRQVAVQIYEILRGRILALDLTPGTVLPRSALMEQFGVSQTPVRDALLHLQDDGLIDIYPQHATMVSRIDIGHARQAQFLRLSIELEMVRRLSADSPRETARALSQVLDRQEAVAHPSTHDQFDALDRDFHRTLYERSRNLALWQVTRDRSVHLDRLRRLNLPMPGKMHDVLRDHRTVTEAIGAGNVDGAAVAALRQHLSGTLSIVGAICDNYPEYIRKDEPWDATRTESVACG